MSNVIGFVILTHSIPDQTLLLCERLATQFENPPIVIHHDFGQCPLDERRFPSNVTFVQDWIRTKWGGTGVVDGLLKALRLLFANEGPDWFVVLSGADYPIKPAQSILADLTQGGFDAYIDHRKILRCSLTLPANGWGNHNYTHPAWVRLAFERYMALGFGFFKLATALGWRRKAFYLRSDFFIQRFTPFNGSLNCYAGDFWFTANRRAARTLLDDSEANRKIIAHFRRRPNPDEGMFQTLLCNAENLKISLDNKRFTDWHGCVNHPRMLGEKDLPTLVASTDHFARKFAFDPDLLNRLDQLVDTQAMSGISEDHNQLHSGPGKSLDQTSSPNS
ncbi:MAG TPA: beta-1,6-N-acetylglucosaminyltransferase [Terracidiphilus sp.]|nr:beta-1,6-N-acetylglucosaminyltransferase [Terracidiphilus sp.]